MTTGHRYTLLCIGLWKRLLTMPSVRSGEQLDWLQRIANCEDAHLGREAIKAIEPMSDLELKMVDEAMALDGDKPNLLPSADVLGSAKAFAAFCAINPSYQRAIEIGDGKPQMPEKQSSAEIREPIGSPPVRNSEPADIQVSPKPEPTKIASPAPGVVPDWRHPM